MRPATDACLDGAAAAQGMRHPLFVCRNFLGELVVPEAHGNRLTFLRAFYPLTAVFAARHPCLHRAFACTQEALKTLRDELAKSLADVETQLETLGGSASTVTAKSMSQKSMKSTKSLRSVKAPSTVAEEDED